MICVLVSIWNLYADADCDETSPISHLEKTQQQMIASVCNMSLLPPDLARRIFENSPQKFKDVVAIIKEAQSRYDTFYDSDYYRTIMPSRILFIGASGVGKSTRC